MGTPSLGTALAAVALLAACREPTTEPAAPTAVSFSLAGQPACPTGANFIVTDEASLRAALSAASPGNVIALNGFFALTADVAITTPSVTLTCATPESGIFAPPGFSGLWLLQVHAGGVTVDGLVLDGGHAPEGPYVAGTDGTSGFFADAARLTNNRVTCGSPNGECAFFVGTREAVVADNRFESAGSSTGIHLQSGIDGSRVERNTVVTSAPSGGEFLGGIRVRDGSNVVVADNVVRGPWGNSIATASLAGTFERNDVAGALRNAVRAVGVRDVVLANNTVSCGGESCALFQGAGGETRTTIADNRFESAGSVAGVQLMNMDGARVERNTVVSTAAAAEGIFASGIAVTGGENLAVTDNVVSGPWTEAALSFDGVFAARVERNRLEGGLDDAVDLFNSGRAQFLNNTVQCGGSCFFANGSPGLVIADNYFQSGGSFSGVHLQAGTDSDHVERNTIVATAPSTGFGFGGIRVRDGQNVVVADNVVQGPWSNSIATTTLAASHFHNNRLEGAGVNGIRFNVGTAAVPIAMRNNSFRNNRVNGAGDAGIFVQAACRNTFVGDNLDGNGGDLGLVFTATAGANVLIIPIGNTASFIDNGNFDCNGDGQPDPNIISGPGRVSRGVPFSPPADVAAGGSKRFR
jgi:hypothetical protein